MKRDPIPQDTYDRLNGIYVVEFRFDGTHPRTCLITAKTLSDARDKAYRILGNKKFTKRENGEVSVYPVHQVPIIDSFDPGNTVDTITNKDNPSLMMKYMEEMYTD